MLPAATFQVLKTLHVEVSSLDRCHRRMGRWPSLRRASRRPRRPPPPSRPRCQASYSISLQRGGNLNGIKEFYHGAAHTVYINGEPSSNEFGTCSTVRTRNWSWLASESPPTLLSCSMFARWRDAWRAYRGTSLIRNFPPPCDRHRALCTGLL